MSKELNKHQNYFEKQSIWRDIPCEDLIKYIKDGWSVRRKAWRCLGPVKGNESVLILDLTKDDWEASIHPMKLQTDEASFLSAIEWLFEGEKNKSFNHYCRLPSWAPSLFASITEFRQLRVYRLDSIGDIISCHGLNLTPEDLGSKEWELWSGDITNLVKLKTN